MSFDFIARAKINWSLNITGLRADGYHLLDMLMQTIDLHDTLEIEPAVGLSLTVDDTPAGEENLVLRAAMALNRHAGTRRGARMALIKRIPARAGLGGGGPEAHGSHVPRRSSDHGQEQAHGHPHVAVQP